MSEARDPKTRERPTEPDMTAEAESALRTPHNAAETRDTVVGELTAPERTQPAASAAPLPRPAPRKVPGETTLVSVPTPADHADVEFEDRLVDCERKLSSLEERVRKLELKGPASAEPSWLVWVVFLLALAVAWQLFQGR